MAVKFLFTLNDIDAENLMSFLQDAESRCLSEIVSFKDKNKPYVEWFEIHFKYIQNMQKKMLENQERIEDSKEYDF